MKTRQFTLNQQNIIEYIIDARLDTALGRGMGLENAWQYAINFSFTTAVRDIESMIDIDKCDAKTRKMIDNEVKYRKDGAMRGSL